ncbi:MAG: hypothetical protein SOZ62_01780 [Eubacteriales bacterium]|nr:hypothetical protein [Eubacteriales bacterium]
MWDKILSFLNKIDDKFFSFDVTQYENLNFSTNKMNSIPKIILAIGLGIIIASIIAYYHKSVLGSVIRALDKSGAVGSENATKLSSVGIKRTGFFEKRLKRDTSLPKYVNFVFESDDSYKYYLVPEKIEEALSRYSNRGSDLRYLIMTVVITVAVVSLLLSFRFEVASALNFLFGLFR